MAASRNVDIRASVSPEAQVRLDPTRFKQILSNLVSNAVRFTPEGGHVVIRARMDKETFRVVVSDTGVGIPKAQAPLVFTEFSKIDAGPLAASKGTGLGLDTVQRIVRKHRGNIQVTSKPGDTRFQVWLPVSEASK